LKQKIADIISSFTSDKFFYSLLVVYALINLAYVFFGQLLFTSDSLYYFQKASECVANGTFYPASHNIHDQYIQSPLYINFLVVLLNIHNSQLTILFANAILNFIQLTLLYFIALQLFNDRQTARISVLVYVFFLTNLGAILLNFSEFLFVTLVLLSFYFFLRKTTLSLFFSGIIIGFALDTKQIAIMLLISFLLTSFYLIKKRKEKINFVYMLFGFALSILSIGFVTKMGFNKFIVTPETAYVNILMGANDEANGTFNADVFEKGKMGYLENEDSLTHSEKTSFYREQAVEWILDNPINWVMKFPVKFVFMYAFDDWSVFTLAHTTEWNLQKILKYVIQNPDDKKIFAGESTIFKLSFSLIYIYHYLFYYTLVFLIAFQVLQIWQNKNKLLFAKFLPIYLFAILGTCSILIGYGAARYKYPFIILLIFTIIPLVKSLLQSSTENNPHKE